MVHAICDGHAYEYTYDSQGNLKEKRANGKLLVAYTYDSTGNITEIQDPAGISIRYEYDLLGRMTCIHSGQGMKVQYGYDSLDRIHYGNGVQTNYAYDCDGNISHLETKTESAVLLSFDYQYDGNGNRTAKTGIQGLTAGSSALDIRYQYDVRGQLLEECRNGAAVRYAYDAAGNRIKKTEGEKESRYRYNQKNQLLPKENTDGISCFTYDRQGGIIEEKTAVGIRRFTYNSLHQQTQVETETGKIQKNRYDAEGLRYELIENGRRTSFIYHNGELLHEKGEEAGLFQEATSYHLGAGIEAFQRDGKIFYYHQDE
jgi:YD repeat-containing protein